MSRVAAITVLILALAGCRSTAPSAVALPPQAGLMRPFPASQPDRQMVRPAVYVQPAADSQPAARVPTVDAAVEQDRRFPELLPLARPQAPSNEPLTLADLEAIAFQHNPTLAVAAAHMEAARGKQLQAGLYPNPVVGYQATEIGNLGTAGQQGAFVRQRLVAKGKLQLDQAIAGSEYDEAHFRFHAQEQRVLNDVRVRFYDAIVAQRRVELTAELRHIGDELVRATETLLAGRRATDNDLLQAKIRADESHILSDSAHNQHAEAWRRVAAVVGLATMQRVPLRGDLDPDLPSLDWDACYATVLASSLELNAARTRVDRASIATRRARRELIPDVDVAVSVRHHNVTADDVANVQIGIPIPLFNKNQGNIQHSEAEWMAAVNDVRRIELDLQDRLAVAYRRYADARQQVDRYQQRMIPNAKKSLDLVTRGYEMGQVEYLTLLTAQQTHLQVNLSYLAAIRDLRATAAVIDGQLLTGSLDEPTR